MRIAPVGISVGGFLRRHRTQLALSVRVTIAALAALVLAQRLQLTLPLWSVLTAVIVTQMSMGRSLMATFDYLIGTLGIPRSTAPPTRTSRERVSGS